MYNPKFPRIDTKGCGTEIDPYIPYWIAFGKVLCDKCGAPMLHKRGMGIYIVDGIKEKQICGEYTKFTPSGKLKRTFSFERK